jgi:hypothetical protein
MAARELIARSTTDTIEQVREALGVPPEPVVETPAAEEKPAETEAPAEVEAKDDAEKVEETPAAEVKPVEKKDKRSVNARIGEALEEKRLARERAERLEDELSKVKRDLELERSAKTTKVEPVVEEAKTEPDENDFPTTEAFVRAHNRWAVDEAKRVAKEAAGSTAKERDDAAAKANYEEGQRQIRAKHEEAKNAAREVYDDFDEVIANPDAVCNQVMVDAFYNEELGPDLLYYFGQRPDESKRVANLPPGLAFREIGKILAKLEPQVEERRKTAKPAAPAPKLRAVDPPVSKAPAPATRVVSREPVGDVPLDAVDSQAEFKRRRNEQIRQNRSR